MELLKDDPNNYLLHDLWKQSYNIRRLCIRELEIDEILERLPGYCRSEMVLAAVKESTDIDECNALRRKQDRRKLTSPTRRGNAP
ncbi:unnamed protein product [Rotaria sp. Silwood2]|nr:unnamed protein product [Rotaria sp. Silwood2]CAF4200710.1 unnamed protein product [Rotaria sp. Silwood2]